MKSEGDFEKRKKTPLHTPTHISDTKPMHRALISMFLLLTTPSRAFLRSPSLLKGRLSRLSSAATSSADKIAVEGPLPLPTIIDVQTCTEGDGSLVTIDVSELSVEQSTKLQGYNVRMHGAVRSVDGSVDCDPMMDLYKNFSSSMNTATPRYTLEERYD